MKEIKVVFDSYFLDDVLSKIKEYGIERYFLASGIISEWSKELKHFDNNVWPGTDSMLIIIVPDDQAMGIMNTLKKIKSFLGEKISMGAIMTNVEDIIF